MNTTSVTALEAGLHKLSWPDSGALHPSGPCCKIWKLIRWNSPFHCGPGQQFNNKTATARLIQGGVLKQYFGWPDQPSSGLD